MTPKKFTRGVFYVLGSAALLTLLYFITEFIVRNWDSLWDIFLVTGLLGVVYGIFRLGMWAFNDTKPKQYNPPTMPQGYPTPNYFDSEEAGLLSDGRYAVPLHSSGKFSGRLPQDPFLNERVGDYRFGRTSDGDLCWLYEPKETR